MITCLRAIRFNSAIAFCSSTICSRVWQDITTSKLLSSKGKAVYGYSIVLLIWTDGTKRIILGERIYKKGGATKIQLALEMLSYARNRLKLKPQYVLFDSWYGSKKIFKRLKDYGWRFVTRLKKNRTFDAKKLCKILNCTLNDLVAIEV